MDLIQYVTQMTDAGSVPAVIGLAILCLFLIFIPFAALIGMRRGTYRQLLHTGLVLLSGVGAFIITKILIGNFTVETLGEWISEAERTFSTDLSALKDAISNVGEDLFAIIISLPVSTVIAPLVFVVIFFAFLLLFFIGYLIIVAACKIRKPKNKTERVGGLCLAAVESILILSVIFLPLTGIAGFSREVYTATVESAETLEETEKLEDFYNKYLLPITENPAVILMENASGKMIASSLATVRINGADSNLSREISLMVKIALIDAPKLKDVNFEKLSDEDKAVFEKLIEDVEGSPLLANVVAGVISTVANKADLKALGINLVEPLNTLVKDTLFALKDCTVDTLGNDLNTIKDVYFLLSDDGAIPVIAEGNKDKLLDILTSQAESGDGSTTVDKLIALLEKNENTKPLVTTLTKLSLSMMQDSLGGEIGDVEQVYNDIKDSMNEVLEVKKENYETEEEYKEALSETLDSNLKKNGIELEKEVVSNIADYIDEHHSDKTDLSDEEFNDIVLSYYDAYLDYLNTGELPDDIPEGILPDDIPEGVLPDDIPEGVLPDDIPEGIVP